MRRQIVAAMILAAGLAPAALADLKVGDPAPELEISKWVKGDPVDLAKHKGKVIIVEFWATWCRPCIDGIPHLTELQAKHEKDLVVIGVSDEPANVIERFVGRMGDKMKYRVAADQRQATNRSYMFASKQQGIPTTFIIDRTGTLAWIGHPAMMDPILERVLAGTYDVKQAQIEAQADAKFDRDKKGDLLMALQMADWKTAMTIAKEVAAPECKMSKRFRSDVLNVVSWSVLTQQKDEKMFKEALQVARVANEISGGKDPSVLETYARALYETGDLDGAISHQRKAVEMAEDPMMKRELDKKLKEYEAEKTKDS